MLSKKKALIIEDDSIMADVLSAIATNAGLSPTTISMIGSLADSNLNAFEVIIVDLWVSDSYVTETLDLLAEKSFSGNVLIVSGLDDSVLEEATNYAKEKNLRLFGVIKKPFNVKQVHSLLRSI